MVGVAVQKLVVGVNITPVPEIVTVPPIDGCVRFATERVLFSISVSLASTAMSTETSSDVDIISPVAIGASLIHVTVTVIVPVADTAELVSMAV
jgi:hypothetical protein